VLTEFERMKDTLQHQIFKSQLSVENLEDEISNKDINLSPIFKSIKGLEKAAIKIDSQRKVCLEYSLNNQNSIMVLVLNIQT